jgi:twinkle protein
MTPQEINEILVGMVDTVAAHLLPNGKKEGRSWCVGSVSGEPGKSLRLCLSGTKAGVWSDFSSNGKGGDLLDLWQQTKGLSFVDTLKEAKEFAGVQDMPELFTPRRVVKKPAKPQCTKPKDQIASWFEGRAIFPKSLDAYKVAQQRNTIVFPFLSPSGEFELVKYRDLDAEKDGGKKKIWSNNDPEYHLFGWQAISDNDRSVVICEGEIDALSWYQQGIPALSIPQGAGGGDKQTVWIENDYDRLQRFETIYISMDMDKPGQETIEPIISRLGVERCKVVDIGEFKDANEAHCEGMVLKNYLAAAKTKDPEELKRLVDHHEEIMDEFENHAISGIRLPWLKTHSTIRLRPAEISVWAGINSHGKSISLSHVVVDAVSQGVRSCIASMEMKPRKLGKKMYQQVAGEERPNTETAKQIVEFLADNVWLFEVYGTAKADRIIEVFSYARKRYGIQIFVVDSLAKCGFGEDDYNGQKTFVDKLMEFAGKNNVHVLLVVHMRKREDELKIPGKMDIKGTGAITDMVDNCFVWWRNKKKEEEGGGGKLATDADAVLNCVKQRDSGEEPMCGLFFHKPSCQFVDGDGEPPKRYLF